jgi:hypothetical protein
VNGFVTTPVYEGVVVDALESPQIRVLPGWGSWPVSHVRAMERLGLGSFWYTSGGSADRRKPPAPLTVTYGTGTTPPTTAPPTTAPPTTTPPSTTPPSTTPPSTTAPPTTTPPTTTPPTTTVPVTTGSGSVTVRAVVPDRPGTEVGGDTQTPPTGGGLPDNAFAWSIDVAAGGVGLELVPGATDEYRFAGRLGAITVVDTRRSATASWSLSGQVSDFSGGLSGTFLGWTPSVTRPGAGAVPGGPVPSGLIAGDGLRSPSLLASAPAGRPAGSATLDAALDLRVPRTTPGGTYTATLTITALG